METRNSNSFVPFSRNDSLGNKRTGVESANRKLIRPSLTEFKEQQTQRKPQKRPIPPEQTNAENFYYVKQMQARTPMVVVLGDGEELHGVIEWYDRGCIKVNRSSGPNLLVYKANIKYLYKESDKNGEQS
ncbi:MAG: Hfq-like protein [bacterium]